MIPLIIVYSFVIPAVLTYYLVPNAFLPLTALYAYATVENVRAYRRWSRRIRIYERAFRLMYGGEDSRQ